MVVVLAAKPKKNKHVMTSEVKIQRNSFQKRDEYAARLLFHMRFVSFSKLFPLVPDDFFFSSKHRHTHNQTDIDRHTQF